MTFVCCPPCGVGRLSGPSLLGVFIGRQVGQRHSWRFRMLLVGMQSPFLEFVGPTPYVSLDLLVYTGVTISEHSIASSVSRVV